MDKPWLKHYPEGVPAEIRTDVHPSLVAMLETSFARHAALPACRFMGGTIRFAQIDAWSRAFAAWLQAQSLQPGDRVAVMLPNVPQYLVAVAAILRAGLVVVNMNPLYAARELEHRLKDSGAKAIVVFESCAATLALALAGEGALRIVIAAAGDLLAWPRGAIVNHVARRVHRLAAPFRLPDAVRWPDALALGRSLVLQPIAVGPEDIALLQYTGGTTADSKAAVLLHRNLVANLLQCEAWYRPALRRVPAGEQVITVCALPLHHIFGFTAIMMLNLWSGGCSLLIPNARDLAAMLKELARQRFHSFPGVDALFRGLAEHADFGQVDWSHLKISVGGGMPVPSATARLWHERTGCPIVEGYGLTETSPSVTCNPLDGGQQSGSIGLPLPGTELVLLDDDGRLAAPGAAGEIAVRGPQVMAGYWQRPDETAKAMTGDGFFRTGDIGTVDERGCFRIVDRKKDMILVSGFNVYPNEVESVITQMPGVQECAAVAVPDAKAGEAVKVIVVRNDPAVTEADIRAHCELNLTGYKRPKVVEFRAELPKTTVGKVLRRELRGAA